MYYYSLTGGVLKIIRVQFRGIRKLLTLLMLISNSLKIACIVLQYTYVFPNSSLALMLNFLFATSMKF